VSFESSSAEPLDQHFEARLLGFFVTYPMYVLAEKAAATIIADAAANGWKPTA